MESYPMLPLKEAMVAPTDCSDAAVAVCVLI